jgi:manganese/zinc/iron transport system permease protein
MNIYLEIILLAVLCALNSALIGSWLVVNGMSLMSDGMSHALILGIAITFCFIHSTTSWLLLVGAGCAGWALTQLILWLMQRHNLTHDAALGLLFPTFFSLGTLLITKYAHNIHLDVDMVLLGEITFAPLKRMIIAGADYGPIGMWYLTVLLLILLLSMTFLFKHLQLCTFDKTFAQSQGISVSVIQSLLLLLTSITTVMCFDLVGSLAIIALMIVPSATALLQSISMVETIALSMFYGALGAIGGCLMGMYFDVSIAGSIATMTGVVFSMQACNYLFTKLQIRN